jgi:NAD(P)-dependent dehydrogenase (short-subunit alcohol dehydrogenase family)
MRLKDQVVIVTGGTSGLGEAIAKKMASEGASVAIVGRNVERGEKILSSILNRNENAKFFKTDVTNEEEVKNMVNSVVDYFGSLDIVVNNAGTVISGNILNIKTEDWETVFRVNVTSSFLVSRYALPFFLEKQNGCIINISSEAGLKGFKDRVAYCAAKSAVVGLTKALTVDHSASGVRVNCICPGTIHTPLISHMLEQNDDPHKLMEEFLGRRITPFLGTTDEIAEACIYFALPHNKYLTGAILSIDGGSLAK